MTVQTNTTLGPRSQFRPTLLEGGVTVLRDKACYLEDGIALCERDNEERDTDEDGDA